jgi:Cu(I)/Ag(I) efflux system membrane protein CusA/SilA
VIVGAALVVALTIPVVGKLGSEFMPPLNEGTILYMPTAVPGISDTSAGDVLQRQNEVLRSFPEVERVFGKAGRFDSPTDPAPLEMFETVVTLKPKSAWPAGEDWDTLIGKLNQAAQFTGMPNVWWMPIQTRTEMLATGVRSPLGIQVLGPDLRSIEEAATRVEAALQSVPGTRSAFAERIGGGRYLDFDVDREAAARYGLEGRRRRDAIETAIGGTKVTQTVEGRERYPVRVRYARDFRSTVDDLRRVLVATPSGAQIPLGQLADIRSGTVPRCSGTKADGSTPTSSPTPPVPSRTTFRMHDALWRSRSSFRPELAWNGRASIATWSEPRRGWPSSFPSRCSSSSCSCSGTRGAPPKRCW